MRLTHLASAFRRKILLLALLLTACAQPAAERQNPAATRVLFIGNSLTTTNGLPAMVEAVAAASGDRLESAAIAFPNVSLEDHWARGDALQAITRGAWSAVVLQQGPSAMADSRVLLREYVRRFDSEVRRSGARTALYMVWPASGRSGDFDAVSESYAIAASDVGGVLLPAGDLWRAAWRRQPGLALYGPDGFHPSPLGSYLAALAIYHGLTGRAPRISEVMRSPVGAFPTVGVPSRTAKMLESLIGNSEYPSDR